VKIVISGASGFIGRRLLKTLGQSGHSLHVLSRHQGTNLPPGVRTQAGSLSHAAACAIIERDYESDGATTIFDDRSPDHVHDPDRRVGKQPRHQQGIRRINCGN
jgi:nucleoside-diphosphate-sugar epimerase